MDNEYTTADLYQLLVKLKIDVFTKRTKVPRQEQDIINDLFKAWRCAKNLSESREIGEALDWMSRSGGDFSAAQHLMLKVMHEEQEEMELECANDRSSELDEFLNSFAIIGGDTE